MSSTDYEQVLENHEQDIIQDYIKNLLTEPKENLTLDQLPHSFVDEWVTNYIAGVADRAYDEYKDRQEER